IASSSALTEIIRGMTLEEAEKLTNKEIAQYLGGLPKEKMHCSVMGQEALQAAIANYRGIPIKKETEGNIVCECFGVTDKEIIRVIKENKLTTREEVTNFTKAGGGCESCHQKIEDILAQVLAAKEIQTIPTRPDRKLTNIQRIRLVQEVMDREISPALKADGGDIELVDIEGKRVLVALRGTCSTCAASQVTLKDYVETKLRELIEDDLVVEEVS
ncbi:MAG: NifU family protein, partial [Deltaproteobacteria bacterium]|nr:NifU family protein [Deltaproteobacteria bacterium]